MAYARSGSGEICQDDKQAQLLASSQNALVALSIVPQASTHISVHSFSLKTRFVQRLAVVLQAHIKKHAL
jgi:hypothetical protein